MNTPISFPLAELLKEKGFDERPKSYNEDGKLVTVSLTIRRLNPEKIYYPAPTIAEVVMCLLEEHKIWIYSHKDGGWWFPVIENFYDEDNQGTKIEDLSKMNKTCFNSPEEAYEAAIEYVLNKLI